MEEGKTRHWAEDDGKIKSTNFESPKTSKNSFRDKAAVAALLSCSVGLREI